MGLPLVLPQPHHALALGSHRLTSALRILCISRAHYLLTFLCKAFLASLPSPALSFLRESETLPRVPLPITVAQAFCSLRACRAPEDGHLRLTRRSPNPLAVCLFVSLDCSSHISVLQCRGCNHGRRQKRSLRVDKK